MPCSECTHCRQAAAQSRFRLPGRPVNAGPRNANLPFYAAFGQAYALARQTGPQPMRLLRDANPGLTASQCSSYLKRARELDYVVGVGKPAHLQAVPEPRPESAPARGRRGRGRRGAVKSSTTAATLQRLDDDESGELDDAMAVWGRNRTRITPDVIVNDLKVPEGDAIAVQRWLVSEGLAEWDDFDGSVRIPR